MASSPKKSGPKKSGPPYYPIGSIVELTKDFESAELGVFAEGHLAIIRGYDGGRGVYQVSFAHYRSGPGGYSSMQCFIPMDSCKLRVIPEGERLAVGSRIELRQGFSYRDITYPADHMGTIAGYFERLGKYVVRLDPIGSYGPMAHHIPPVLCRLVGFPQPAGESDKSEPSQAQRLPADYKHDLLYALRTHFNQLMPVDSTDRLLAFYARSDVPLLMVEVLFVAHFCSYDHLTVLSEEEQQPFHNLALGTLRVLQTSPSSIWPPAVSSVVAEGEKDDWDDDDC